MASIPNATKRVPITEVGFSQCRFVVDDRNFPALCCGEPTLGGSWCAHHRALVFVRVPAQQNHRKTPEPPAKAPATATQIVAVAKELVVKASASTSEPDANPQPSAPGSKTSPSPAGKGKVKAIAAPKAGEARQTVPDSNTPPMPAKGKVKAEPIAARDQAPVKPSKDADSARDAASKKQSVEAAPRGGAKDGVKLSPPKGKGKEARPASTKGSNGPAARKLPEPSRKAAKSPATNKLPTTKKAAASAKKTAAKVRSAPKKASVTKKGAAAKRVAPARKPVAARKGSAKRPAPAKKVAPARKRTAAKRPTPAKRAAATRQRPARKKTR